MPISEISIKRNQNKPISSDNKNCVAISPILKYLAKKQQNATFSNDTLFSNLHKENPKQTHQNYNKIAFISFLNSVVSKKKKKIATLSNITQTKPSLIKKKETAPENKKSKPEFRKEPPILSRLKPVLKPSLGLLSCSDFLVPRLKSIDRDNVFEIDIESVASGHDVRVVHDLEEGLDA